MLETQKKHHQAVGKKLAEEMTVSELSSQLRHSSKALPKLGIPKYCWWNECLHGVARAGVATVFPQAIAMASTFDPDILYRAASIISTEARAKYNAAQSVGDCGIYKGLTMWSPNINIFRDPRWGRGQETYGEDPCLTSRMGVAFIRGLQGGDDKYIKTAACAKHFAVHSGPEEERHTFNAEVSKKDLFETYLPAFEKAVTEGKVCGVMGAYNRINGEAACASAYFMQHILRDGWGFDGYYVTDCGALLDVVFHHKVTLNPAKGAALALKAGCDLECGTLYSLLPLSYELGYVSKAEIQQAAARVLGIRSSLGMFDKDCPYNQIDLTQNANAQHEAYAVEVARKGIVLLKNDGILPMKSHAQRIFITGWNAENDLAYLGNYCGEPSAFLKLPEAVRQENAQTQYLAGIHLYNPKKCEDREKALQKAAECDVILVCTGLDPSIEGEEAGGILAGGGGRQGKQGDREDLELPQVQQDYLDRLLQLGKKVILLNFSGGCIDFRRYAPRVNAILQCWYPGAKGGKAIADLLFGKASPSGKLPITFYNSADDLPPFTDYNMHGRTYRYFKGEVQYPFGYGLTYTTFALRDFQFDTATGTACVTVTNTGKTDCDEVLELYISYPKAEVELPLRSLLRTKRLFLPAGAAETVEFRLQASDFYTLNEQADKVLLHGVYRLQLWDGQSTPAELSLCNEAETVIKEACKF